MKNPQIMELLWKIYGLQADQIEKSAVGAGSDTYFVTCGQNRYVLKFPAESSMNQPALEPELCAFLNEKGIPACRFIPNRQGSCLSSDPSGRVFHLQVLFEGKTYGLNEAPPWLLTASAQMLGRIHTALRNYKGLPIGIGPEFFRFMTPENARESYRHTLKIAEEKGDAETAEALRYRIALTERMEKPAFDLSALTCTGTHGDYFISQLICAEQEIRAVIDWTTACVHPVIWEIIRSYVYASPRCAGGCLDAEEFLAYTAAYMTAAPLTAADIRAMVPLFFYQLAVCDYYRQYFESDADNRRIYLHQAEFSTKLLQWLEKHGAELQRKLEKAFIQ